MGQIPGGYSGGQVVRGSQSGGWDEDLEGAGGSSIQHQVRVRVAYHRVASSPHRDNDDRKTLIHNWAEWAGSPSCRIKKS